MNPEGFDLNTFDLPFSFIFDFVPKWVQPVECEKLTLDQEYDLCWTKNFTHVYYIVYPAYLDWSHDKEWIILVKHKSGYYIYLRAFHDKSGPYLIDNGCIRYSKSWDSIWYQILSEEERNNIKSLPWYRTHIWQIVMEIILKNYEPKGV